MKIELGSGASVSLALEFNTRVSLWLAQLPVLGLVGPGPLQCEGILAVRPREHVFSSSLFSLLLLPSPLLPLLPPLPPLPSPSMSFIN